MLGYFALILELMYDIIKKESILFLSFIFLHIEMLPENMILPTFYSLKKNLLIQDLRPNLHMQLLSLN